MNCKTPPNTTFIASGGVFLFLTWTHLPKMAFLFVIIYDLTEVRLQSCATDQTTVDVRLGKELSCVACIHGSAVLDANCLCSYPM